MNSSLLRDLAHLRAAGLPGQILQQTLHIDNLLHQQRSSCLVTNEGVFIRFGFITTSAVEMFLKYFHRHQVFLLDAVVDSTCPCAGAWNTDFLSIEFYCLGFLNLNLTHLIGSKCCGCGGGWREAPSFYL